jgi:hypothetical protein
VAIATASLSLFADATVKFEVAESTAIAAAFSAFIKVQQQLLAAFVATGSFLAQIPLVVAPISVALTAVKSIIAVSFR